MVVRIKRKEEYSGTATPSALNAETDLINLGTYEGPIMLEGYVDLRNMQSGDSVTLRLYVAVDGSTRSKADEVVVDSPPSVPVVRLITMTLRKEAQPRVTITQTAGTLRSFPYWFIVQVLEEL